MIYINYWFIIDSLARLLQYFSSRFLLKRDYKFYKYLGIEIYLKICMNTWPVFQDNLSIDHLHMPYILVWKYKMRMIFIVPVFLATRKRTPKNWCSFFFKWVQRNKNWENSKLINKFKKWYLEIVLIRNTPTNKICPQYFGGSP